MTRGVRSAALGLALLAGCELDKTAIPRTNPELALHGVLSASASTQVVLLERTRTGRVSVLAPPFDLGDPVVSDEGIAESGALITLTAPDGSTIVAREDNTTRSDGKGQGIYRFTLPGSLLVRNATYRLTVRTTGGDVLSAETSVPDGTPVMTASLGTMDRSQGELLLSWPASATARSYFVRVETPYGPRAFFTESTQVRLPGLLRNVDLQDLQHVFFPGFMQAVTVSAVDSNYYDWYRTHNDVLSGEGLINRVAGGLGVFGSLVRLRFDSVLVTAPKTRPVEGGFQLNGSAIETAASDYLSFDIYVESPAARSGQSDALSGNYHYRPTLGYEGCLVCGVLGSAKDGHVELALLKDYSGADTVEVFEGRLTGDTLIGVFRFNGGPFRFVRQPAVK
jgi:hypothetical protein